MRRSIPLGALLLAAACGDAGTWIEPPRAMGEGIAQKSEVMERQTSLLDTRYDLSDLPSTTVRMTRGRPVQIGVRIWLPRDLSWDALATLSAEEIRENDLLPVGFLPLPHIDQRIGGAVFPQSSIAEIERQTGRDLSRFDLEFDLPEHLLPEFPPAIFLVAHPELGDVSQGRLVTEQNYRELFQPILSPSDLARLRSFVEPTPRTDFNPTPTRRTAEPSAGVACFDCHLNGHDYGAIDLAAGHRSGAASLRGRPEQLFDLPPAPKLDPSGHLDRARASAEELRGEALFFGKARCGSCHPAPAYTDHAFHDLSLERFYRPRMINGLAASGEGPIETPTLKGIKESPPYLHDQRLLTLDDTIEFFNLIHETKLTAVEKEELLAFLYVL